MENSKALTVLITGASSGLGVEYARQFHARGDNLVLVARREDRLQELCEELNAQRANSARYMATDLATEGGCIKVEEFIRNNQIDILVNNAGRGSYGTFDSIELKKELEMVALNVVAPMRLTHAVIPQMKARRQGAIIMLASVAGFQPVPYMTTYAATKAYDLFHALGLRYELAPFGVKVVAICPGPTATEFRQASGVPNYTEGQTFGTASEVVRESLNALEKNYAWLVPCLKVKVIFFFMRLLPLSFMTWLTGVITKGKH